MPTREDNEISRLIETAIREMATEVRTSADAGMVIARLARACAAVGWDEGWNAGQSTNETYKMQPNPYKEQEQ